MLKFQSLFNKTILFVLALSCVNTVNAEPIKFEQGGASNSPGIVAPGRLQIESMLFSYTQLNGTNDSLFDLGESLFRYGLIQDRLEIRTRVFGLSFRDSQVGIDSLSLGTKLGLTKEKGLVPNADLIVDFAIPLNHDFYPDNFTHSYRLTMDHSLTKKLSVANNLALVFAGTQNPSSNDFTRVQMPYVFSLGYAVTDKLTINEEIFGIWSLSGNQGNSLGLATYATYLINDDFAATATLLTGLNNNTDPITVNMGLVYRL
jgi:hypothetical protein